MKNETLAHSSNMSLSILLGKYPTQEQVDKAAHVYLDMMLENPNKSIQVVCYQAGKRLTTALLGAIVKQLHDRYPFYWDNAQHNVESLSFELHDGKKTSISILSAIHSTPPSPHCVLEVNIMDL